MKITSKEILLWQILKDKIKNLEEGIAGQMRIIDLAVQMDIRHNRRRKSYPELEKAVATMMKKKAILLRRFNKIDEKVEAYAELV